MRFGSGLVNTETILLIKTISLMTLNVLATFEAGRSEDGMVAERIEVPARTAPEAFAAALVVAEGLTSWSAQDPTSSGPGSTLHWKARHAADGREVTVYYEASQRSVCRIRRPHGGMAPRHYQAVRWCAALLGVRLPERPADPVR